MAHTYPRMQHRDIKGLAKAHRQPMGVNAMAALIFKEQKWQANPASLVAFAPALGASLPMR
jgi:hypothetical protein